MFHLNLTNPYESAFAEFLPATGIEGLPVLPSVPAVVETTVFAMNTPVTFRIHGDNVSSVLTTALHEMNRLENLFSRYRPKSEISRLNQSASSGPVDIDHETMTVLSAANHFTESTDGSFNYMIGPLMDLWNFKEAIEPPAEADIQDCMNILYAGLPVLDRVRSRAWLTCPGQSVDLGGIAKGYAGDRCLEIFKHHGIQSAFINLGGNVAALGTRPDGLPWRVGIRHPRQAGNLLGAVEVCSQSVVTSGDYERFFVDSSGRRRHHLLNPHNGYPARSGLTSATVIAADGMAADALSTALFVSGLDAAGSYLSSYPGIEAVLVDEYLRVFISPGLRNRFHPAEGISVQTI